MPVDHTRLTELFELLIRQQASLADKAELAALVRAGSNAEQIEELLNGLFDKETAAEYYTIDQRHQLAASILENYPAEIIDFPNGNKESVFKSSVHRVHFLKTAWFRVAVAILIIIGISTYLWFQPSINKPSITQTQPVPAKNDVFPGYNRAMLTLSDGKKVTLDSAGAKTIHDGSVAIINNEGQLYYSGGEVVAMNTMTTPKGGQYQLTLADGTRVWLNAASSITFPTAFKGKTREVFVTGEAYFVVSKDAAKPLIVKTNKENITVLGTEFNANIYADEIGKITLINGTIKVNETLLRPGQAFQKNNIISTNIDQDVAWKNGAFNFQDMDLVSALKQLARWYDLDVRFEGKVPVKKLRGELGRDLNLSQILKALKAIEVNTKLEGKVLTVLSR